MAAPRRAHVLLETVALAADEISHLLALGVRLKTAIQHGVSSKSYWHMARTPAVQQALSNAWLEAQGLLSVRALWCKARGYAAQVTSSSAPNR